MSDPSDYIMAATREADENIRRMDEIRTLDEAELSSLKNGLITSAGLGWDKWTASARCCALQELARIEYVLRGRAVLLALAAGQNPHSTEPGHSPQGILGRAFARVRKLVRQYGLLLSRDVASVVSLAADKL
jgi:hypothetical protein